MMTCDFRSFEEAWSAPQRRVWMVGESAETSGGAETTREATRETSAAPESDADTDGSDAAAAAQAAARELIARVQDPTHETYGQLNDRARQGLVATLTQMFNEETDEYKTRVAQFQTVYEEELKGNGQELARDLEAIVALAEGKAPAPATLTGPAVAPEGIRQHPNFKPAMAALDDVKFGIPEHDLPAGINVNDGSFRGAITSIGRFRGALGKFSQGTARNAFAEHVGMNPSLIIAGSKNTLKLTYNQDNGQVTAEIIDKTSPEAVAARATQAARRQAQRERAPAPAPAAAPEIQILNSLVTVQRGDTMSAIIRNKLANNDMDPLRTQIARQYGLGDGFPTYAGGDTDGAQFMRLLMAKRNPDYYQNLIHPGDQVHFNENGEITIIKGSAQYAPGEKERVATGGTTRAESAPAAAPERPSEKIAALEKNWTEIIEPEIRKGAGKVSVTVSETQSSGPNNLEKTITLTNASGKTVKLIIKPPTSPIEETYGIDASKQRFLVVDTEGKQTGYTSVFGSGNQLDFALNLLRTPDKSTVEAPAAPAAEPPASDAAAAATPAEAAPAAAEAREAARAVTAKIKEYLKAAAKQNTLDGFKTAMEEYTYTFSDYLAPMSVDLRKEIVTAVGMQFLDKDAIGGDEGIFRMSVDNVNPALGSFDLYYDASKNQFNTRKVPLAEARRARRAERIKRT